MTHEDYVMKVKADAEMQVKAGFLLEPEAQDVIDEADAAHIPPK